jgi:SAM-dependent methyltransferase
MAGPEDITLFSSVDRTKEPDFFKRFLDEGNKNPGIIASKPIILAGLQLTGGEKVLDAGCGLGDDTFEIAQIVGSQGRAVGIDVSETMILEARRRAVARGLPAEFEVGDAQALRFTDATATFDACRTERMLMHVPDAERAFTEMVRVIRRGGRLSVFDFDWETQIVDSPYTETTRLITRSFCDNLKNGWIDARPAKPRNHDREPIEETWPTAWVHFFHDQAVLVAPRNWLLSFWFERRTIRIGGRALR